MYDRDYENFDVKHQQCHGYREYSVTNCFDALRPLSGYLVISHAQNYTEEMPGDNRNQTILYIFQTFFWLKNEGAYFACFNANIATRRPKSSPVSLSSALGATSTDSWLA